MDINEIKKSIRLGIKVEYSAHCQKRMLERDILRADIRNCILTGEIIEDYPLDIDNNSEKSLPCCLICGEKAKGDEVIHVVVGYDGKKLLIISACYPDTERWQEGFKRRK